jgi:hypothetical protein
MNDQQRAAMQGALLALEDAHRRDEHSAARWVYSEAMDALREALNTRSSSTHSDAEYSEVAQPQDLTKYREGYEQGKFDAKMEALAQRCPDCGEVNPAEIHTCSPQLKQPQGEWVDLTPHEVTEQIREAGTRWVGNDEMAALLALREALAEQADGEHWNPDDMAYRPGGLSMDQEQESNSIFMEGYRIGLAEMREKCAKVCDDIERKRWETMANGGTLVGWTPKDCAAAIRSMK